MFSRVLTFFAVDTNSGTFQPATTRREGFKLSVTLRRTFLARFGKICAVKRFEFGGEGGIVFEAKPWTW